MLNETRNAASGHRPAPLGDSARHARIAIAAYYRAERRGFAPGREIDDWLEAEREVDRGTPSRMAPATETERMLAGTPGVPPEAPEKAKARKSRSASQRTTRR